MTAVISFVAGALVALVLWPAMRSIFAAAVLQRENYRGHVLPVATGLVVVLSLFVVAVGHLLLHRLDVVNGVTQELVVRSFRQTSILAGGLGLLGLLDDLVGDATSRGFRGHLTALAHGRLTTGSVKLLATPLVAAVALNGFVTGSGADLVLGVLIVSLAANAANLFDRAPGRTIKVTLLGALVLVAVGGLPAVLAGPAAVLGAGAGMLPVDLRERGMLGDTGANVLGGAAGYAVTLSLGRTGELVALGLLLAVNAGSELVSYSRVIDRTPPLRWLDRLGRTAVSDPG